MLAVTILGNNSAIPAHDRHPTSQLLQTHDHTMLIDCGEGTQMQIERYRIRIGKMNHIFISHLHGDHYFGLIGLLTSLGLLGRKNDLHVYAPPQLKTILDLQLSVADARLPYELHFHALQEEGTIFEDKKLKVECFAMFHRIECWGFIFREKKNLRKILPEEVRKYNVPSTCFEALHAGEDYVAADGSMIANELLTTSATPPKVYAFCGDTLFNEKIAEKVRHADLLYHEATYLHDLQHNAASRFHSTSIEAATIAKKAVVKKLLLGHFSSKYATLDEFKIEACSVFENSEVAIEGMCYWI